MQCESVDAIDVSLNSPSLSINILSDAVDPDERFRTNEFFCQMTLGKGMCGVLRVCLMGG